MFKVKDIDGKIKAVNTPCDKCDLEYKGGFMKSGKELFKIGWHVHAHTRKDGIVEHTVFIDAALYDAYIKKYPNGPFQQLIEASEKD